MVGDEELVEGIEKGTKVRVKTPVTVFHSPKLGDFNLEGKEGEVLEVSHLLSCSSFSVTLPPTGFLAGLRCSALQHMQTLT